MAILAVLALFSFAAGSEDLVGNRGSATNADDSNSPDLFNAWLAILLTVLGATFTLFHSNFGIPGLRPESTSLLVIWIVGTRMLYKRQQARATLSNEPAQPINEKPSTGRALYRPILVFALGSAIIFLVAPLFADCARQFSALSGWGDSFVGTWLLGFSTAMPEFVTSMTACRLGAFDLAVGNLYGSCAFNMVVFFMMDLVSKRPVFTLLDPVLALSGFLAVVLMLLGVAAVTFRRQLALAWNLSGGFLLASYGVAIWILYAFR
jgi:cation:H+ antiporter